MSGHRSRKQRTRTCIFAGPSLCPCAPRPPIETFPPLARGMLAAAVRAGYTRIGVIDGAIDDDERTPLHEFREALAAPGVEIIGAASIGALRAAELAADGMRGVGHVHRLFRCGALAEDDVYVLHAPAPLRYRCLTLPLVNVRYTLRAMRVDGRISRADEQALLAYLREVPWFDRDRHSVCAAAYAIFGGTRSGLAMQAFDLMYRDVKREDALHLVARLNGDCADHRARRLERA